MIDLIRMWWIPRRVNCRYDTLKGMIAALGMDGPSEATKRMNRELEEHATKDAARNEKQ
jgi:hypothetical protein